VVELPATVLELAGDRTSGAAQIAERAAHTLVELGPDDAREAALVLARAHPSMAPLLRLASLVLDHPSRGAREFIEEMLGFDSASARVAAGVLPAGTIVTISFSTTVLEALRVRRPKMVLCMESEPGGEGVRAAQAAARFAETRLLPDVVAMDTVPADAVLVGADAVTPDAVVNKVKTRRLAESASRLEVPCYAVAGLTKFVSPGVRVTECSESVQLDLFIGIAAPEGLLTAERARALADSRSLHPLLFDQPDGYSRLIQVPPGP